MKKPRLERLEKHTGKSINTLFADSLYGGGISGVHTGAAQAEVEPKNIVLGAVSYIGWVKDKNS